MCILKTFHNTILSYNAIEHKLYHEVPSKNLIVNNCITYTLDENKIYFNFKDSYIKFNDEDVILSVEKIGYDYVYNSDDEIMILIDNKYLSARKNGAVSLVNQNQLWERFKVSFNDSKDIFKINFNQYCEINKDSKLALVCGCGNRNYGKDYFHTDINNDIINNIYKLDITQPIPIENNILDFIYVEHVLEHLTIYNIMNFCEEANRILKWGGY